MKTEKKAARVAAKNRRHRTDEEIRANHAQIEERNAHFRRFGYDSEAGVAFVIAQALPLRGRVLDIGTGKGRFLVALASHAVDVTTVDLSAREQHCARLEAAYAGVAGRIRFIVRDAGILPWRTARFAAVVSMNAVHHMDDPDRVLAEMLRVLQPGGKLVIADFSTSGFRLMDRIHRAEGRRHPHPASRFAAWRAQLRSQGFRVQRFRGCHQDVLVGVQHPPGP
jgi:ubiquinone/menaquinone biosynthesis C-methylase UbiE